MAAKSVEFVQAIAIGIICMLVKNTGEGLAELTCNEVKKDMYPCGNYIVGGGAVTGECCLGWIALVKAANQTKADTKNACYCLKEMVDYLKDEELERAASIHTPCGGVNLPFNISRNMDCSNYLNLN